MRPDLIGVPEENASARGPARARPLIALTVAAALAIPVGPWSRPAAAQPAQNPTITFLNPSDYGAIKAASRRDMDDHGYHITTTVSAVPPDPRVVIELESSSEGRRRLGIATQQGPDTFAFRWAIPPSEDLPSGTYSMTAILFSGQSQVGEESTEVQVQPDWPTVRIDAPGNGDRMGVYQPPGEDAGWHTVIDYTFSSGTEIVAFFYSTTPPGGTPEWNGCGDVRVSSSLLAGAEEPGSRRHRCELDEEHEGSDVTAVAAIATDDPFPLPRMGSALLFGDTSGDAHRVAPYRQIPARVDLSMEGPEPGTGGQRRFQTETCTDQIVARVQDQHGRPVGGVNVDVHATGPAATQERQGLRFDVSRGSEGTDPNQPPNDGHSDETTAWSCAPRNLVQGPGAAGSQGNHRVPGGPDTRHIESSGGTNLGGRFRSRLYSDQPGTTQVSAWTDLDGDDRYCSLEPAAHLSLGWNQSPPPTEPHAPERDDCEIPGMAGTSERTVTKHERRIGINFRRKGERLVIKGRVRVESGHRPCHRGTPVRVQRRKGNRWKTLRTTATNRKGRYAVRVKHRNGRYRAVAVRTFKGRDNQHVCRRAAAKKRYRRQGRSGRSVIDRSAPAPRLIDGLL